MFDKALNSIFEKTLIAFARVCFFVIGIIDRWRERG